MRRLFSYCFALLFSISVIAQNSLTVHQKDGQQFSFGFDEKPVVTFTDNELIVTTTKTELRYNLAQVHKFTFDDIEDAVVNIKADAAQPSISLDEYTVNITGAKSGESVHLIASDGKTLQTYKISQEGTVSFSIADLPQGTYIISSESLNVKILKK